MVTNIIIACNRCGTTFRLRWQVEDYKAPVLIRCPKCNSKIRGLLQTGVNLSLSGSFNNAYVVENADKADYVQEVSTEFITHKLVAAEQFPALVELYNRNYLSLMSTLMLDDEQVDLEKWGLSSVDYSLSEVDYPYFEEVAGKCDAKWTIGYHSPDDLKRAIKLVDRLKLKNVTVFGN